MLVPSAIKSCQNVRVGISVFDNIVILLDFFLSDVLFWGDCQNSVFKGVGFLEIGFLFFCSLCVVAEVCHV